MFEDDDIIKMFNSFICESILMLICNGYSRCVLLTNLPHLFLQSKTVTTVLSAALFCCQECGKVRNEKVTNASIMDFVLEKKSMGGCCKCHWLLLCYLWKVYNVDIKCIPPSFSSYFEFFLISNSKHGNYENNIFNIIFVEVINLRFMVY